MPLRSLTFEVADGGGTSGTFSSLAVMGTLTGATVGAVDSGVPQTYVRISLFDPVNNRGVKLIDGWPSNYNTNIPLAWTGVMRIPKDYSYYVFGFVRNLAGITQKWRLEANYEEDGKRGRFDRPNALGI